MPLVLMWVSVVSLSMTWKRTLLRWVGSVYILIYRGVLCRHLACRYVTVPGELGKACRSLRIWVLWAEGDTKGAVVILWVDMYTGTKALYIFISRVFRCSALMLSCHASHGLKVDFLSYTRIFANCSQSSAHSDLSCIAPSGETPPGTSQFDLTILTTGIIICVRLQHVPKHSPNQVKSPNVNV